MLVGINIGGTTTSTVLGDETGTIAARRSFPTASAQAADVMVDAIVADVSALRGEAAEPVERVGVSVGGPLDAAGGVLLRPPHLWWFDGFPLRDVLAERMGVPVTLHHDAAACALAEYRWGPDAGADGLGYLTCGTGFGVGLVLRGRAHYGAGGLSPEIGHVRWRDDGPNIFGKPGCFEGYASASALARIAAWRNPLRFANATAPEIAVLASAGDAEARAIVELNAQAVGAACALLVDLLGLDVIVLGSAAQYLGPLWVEAIEAWVRREALPQKVERCTIRPSPLIALQDLSGLAAALHPVV